MLTQGRELIKMLLKGESVVLYKVYTVRTEFNTPLSEKDAWQYLVDNISVREYVLKGEKKYWLLFLHIPIDPPYMYLSYGLCDLINAMWDCGKITSEVSLSMLDKIPPVPEGDPYKGYVWSPVELKPRLEFCKQMVKYCEDKRIN